MAMGKGRLSQWPTVVRVNMLQFPSNGFAIADGAEQRVPKAAMIAIA
jgi:hypothetical protein